METIRLNEQQIADVARLMGVTLDAFGLSAEEQLKALLISCEKVARREKGEPWTTCRTAVYAGLFASLWRRPLNDADDLLTEKEFRDRSGLTANKLAKLRDLDRILCVKRDEGLLYPEFQTHRGGLLHGVVDVNAATSRDGLTGATRVLLMLWPCFGDDSCIVEALRQGRTEEALAAARSFQGFVV